MNLHAKSAIIRAVAFPLSDAEHGAIKARINAQEELIIAAAVRVGGVIVMAERPGRHGDCINFLSWLKQPHDDHGFVTNRGRFVDRQEAAKIVATSGQGSHRDMGPRYPAQLFSEDMWNDWDVHPTAAIEPETVF